VLAPGRVRRRAGSIIAARRGIAALQPTPFEGRARVAMRRRGGVQALSDMRAGR